MLLKYDFKIMTIISYYAQERKEDERYFGQSPGHFELALGSLGNSPTTTDFFSETSSFLYD